MPNLIKKNHRILWTSVIEMTWTFSFGDRVVIIHHFSGLQITLWRFFDTLIVHLRCGAQSSNSRPNIPKVEEYMGVAFFLNIGIAQNFTNTFRSFEAFTNDNNLWLENYASVLMNCNHIPECCSFIFLWKHSKVLVSLQ